MLTVDPVKDPEGTGLTIFAMLRALYAAQQHELAGQLLLGGALERPLAVRYGAGATATAVNPVHAGRAANPRFQDYTFPILYQGPTPRLGSEPFPVPCVLHAMWRSVEGRLGLLIANWTSEPQGFRATLDPELYDLPRHGYRIRELVQGAPARELGTFGGTIEVRGEDSPVVLGGDLFLGRLAPRVLRVLVFEP